MSEYCISTGCVEMQTLIFDHFPLVRICRNDAFIFFPVGSIYNSDVKNKTLVLFVRRVEEGGGMKSDSRLLTLSLLLIIF